MQTTWRSGPACSEPLRQGGIGALIVQEFYLHLAGVGSLHKVSVHIPVVWADQLGPLVTKVRSEAIIILDSPGLESIGENAQSSQRIMNNPRKVIREKTIT
jgi:hypothetical protein